LFSEWRKDISTANVGI